MTEAAPTMHCLTFPDGHVRVSIEKALSGDALLPLPNGSGEHSYVKDAVGSFVAWPKEFVILENVVVSVLTIFYILIVFLRTIIITILILLNDMITYMLGRACSIEKW